MVKRQRRTAGVRPLAGLLLTSTLALGVGGQLDSADASSADRLAPIDAVPTLTAATFATPPPTVRPKYRWWVPLADTDDAELRAEIKQMADAGAGGFEFTAWGVPGSPDLEQVGFGTPAWVHKLQVVIAEATKYGLVADQNLGPAYNANVPSVTDPNDPAVQQQLVYGTQTVLPGLSFAGPLPTPTGAPSTAKTRTVAVVAARCTQALCLPSAAGPVEIDRSTVVDLTSEVVNGELTWTAPADGSYTLFNFLQTPLATAKSGYDAVDNLIVDHLSTTGARALADYYDSTILTPRTQALIDAAPGPAAFFEDSLELGSVFDDSGPQLWTHDFGQEFTTRRGYSVATALPALTGIEHQGTKAPKFDFSDGSGGGIRRDYRQTVSDLYIDNYAGTLESWANTHGMTFRAQSYGLPIQTGVAAMKIGIPEGESINFGARNSYGAEQNYRVVAGGAHLAGKTRVSAECCGIFSGQYRTTVAGPDASQSITTVPEQFTAGLNGNGNADTIFKAFAGGVTQVVWHGFAYLTSPSGLASTQMGQGGYWPGYNPWVILAGALNVSEMAGPRLPQWDDSDELNDALSRNQLVLRQGAPSLDLSVYYQDFGLVGSSMSPPESPNHFFTTKGPLTQAGYSLDYHPQQAYLGATGLGANRTLFPGHGSERAVLLNNQTTMPLDAARKILSLAQQGLPVVVIGSTPSEVPSDADPASDAALRATVADLLTQPTVRRVADESAAVTALRNLGVTPSAAMQKSLSTPLEVVHRDAGQTHFYWLYNPSGETQTQQVTLSGSGRPYVLDTWTGQITPLAQYAATPTGTTVSVTVPPHSTAVYALTTSSADPFSAPVGDAHAVDSTGDPFYAPDGSLAVRADKSGPVITTLSDGRTVTTQIDNVGASRALDTWSLTAESWTPGATIYETTKTPVGPMTVSALPDGTLPSWTLLPGLTVASGTGTYTATVDLGSGWTGGYDATLALGKAVDTATVKVNGQALPPVDPSGLTIPARFLHAGTNTITVRVATTLFNAVQSQTANVAFLKGAPQQYGLLGPVTLTPHGVATVVDAPAASTTEPTPGPTPGIPGLPTTAPTPNAGPPAASTRTRIRLPRPVHTQGGRRARVLLQVVGTPASTGTAGSISLTLDGRVVRTYRTAVTPKRGRTVVGLTYRAPRRLRAGNHTLRASFVPNDASAYTPSTSRAVRLTLVTRRTP